MAIFAGKTLGALLTLLGWDGTEFRNVKVDSEGHLQIDALVLALPSGAATAANQATAITALQSLQNLVGALGDVALDELRTQVITSVLPTDAATQTTLATLATEAKLELVRLLLVSLAAEDFATQTTLALLLTELALKADLTETQPVSMASLPLPSGGATSANQTLMITALQLIDDLRGALHSVSTDTLRVRGEGQLFSFGDKLLDSQSNVDTGAGVQDLFSTVVPVGMVWVVTGVAAQNTVTVCSSIYLHLYDSGDTAAFLRKAIPTILEGVTWTGHVYMVTGDRILARFEDCVAHDLIYLDILGYKMLKAADGGPPPPGEQDLTGYIEVDDENRLTVDEDTVTAVDVDTEARAYVYKDFGVDYFDALHIEFDFRVGGILVASIGCGMGVANVIGPLTDWGGTSVQSLLWINPGANFLIYLRSGTGVPEDSYVAAIDTTYYCTLLRDAGGDVVTLKIYSDAIRFTLLDTLTGAGYGTTKWRYLFAFVSPDYDNATPKWIGHVGNLAIG